MNIHTFLTSYNCNVCKKRFEQHKDLQNHMKLHAAKRVYPCDMCDKVFTDYDKRKYHILLHTDKSEAYDRTYLPSSSGKTNPKSHNDNDSAIHCRETYKCDLCSATFVNVRLFAKHTNDHNKLQQYKCTECNENFAESLQLIDHTKKMHKKPYKCDICGQCFGRISFIRQHMKMHINHIDKPYKCKFCAKRFTIKTELKLHCRTKHVKVKKYKCDNCTNLIFNTYSELYEHNMIMHTIDMTYSEYSYKCKICGKSFKSPDDLKNHSIEIHKPIIKETLKCNDTNVPVSSNNVKPYKCEKCNEKCLTVIELKTHIENNHKKQKTYKCENCKKIFSVKADLNVHLNKKGCSEKTYKCKICGKIIMSSRKLKDHMTIHDNKVFKCKLCVKIFSSAIEIEAHNMKIHNKKNKEK